MADKSQSLGNRDPSLVKLYRDVGSSTGALAEVVSAGKSMQMTASMTRTGGGDTNVYAIGDLMANSVTANAVVPISFTVPCSGILTGASLNKTGTSVTGASFNLHLFSVSPTVTNGDNGVFLSNQAASWLCTLQVSSMKACSDGAFGSGIHAVRNQAPITVPAGGGTIYGLQEANGVYTPISAEVFNWALDFLRD